MRGQVIGDRKLIKHVLVNIAHDSIDTLSQQNESDVVQEMAREVVINILFNREHDRLLVVAPFKFDQLDPTQDILMDRFSDNIYQSNLALYQDILRCFDGDLDFFMHDDKNAFVYAVIPLKKDPQYFNDSDESFETCSLYSHKSA